MELRSLGTTRLLVTPIGLGLAALGRPGYINLGHAEDLEGQYAVESMAANAEIVLDAAWEAGLRYFDAARSYGRAEAFLGNWLRRRDIPPSDAVVGSKWGYRYTAGWEVDAEVHEVKEHSPEMFESQWAETQGHLGEYLNLYQIHSATLESGVLENRAVLRALARRKQEGIAIGLSLSGANQRQTLAHALEILVDGQMLFDAVQATWNLLEPSAGPLLAQARREGMGVIVKEALANGRLTPRNDHPEFAPKLARLSQAAQRLQTTIDALALRAVLAQPWVDLVLSGAARVDHLRSNVRALTLPWDDELEASLAELAEPPEVYWQTRAELAWN